MDKATYMEFLNSKPAEISLTDDQIKSWVDGICDAIHELKDSLYELQFGKYDSTLERYEHRISVCGLQWVLECFPEPEVQIYKNIHVLAEATKSPLQALSCQISEFPFKHHFTYRGVMFFQLAKTDITEEQA